MLRRFVLLRPGLVGELHRYSLQSARQTSRRSVARLRQRRLSVDSLGQEEQIFLGDVGYGIKLDAHDLNEYTPSDVPLSNLLAGRFRRRLGYERPRPRDYHMAPAADADRDD